MRAPGVAGGCQYYLEWSHAPTLNSKNFYSTFLQHTGFHFPLFTASCLGRWRNTPNHWHYFSLKYTKKKKNSTNLTQKVNLANYLRCNLVNSYRLFNRKNMTFRKVVWCLSANTTLPSYKNFIFNKTSTITLNLASYLLSKGAWFGSRSGLLLIFCSKLPG